MSNNLGPLQAGIGSIANAVMCGLIESPFENLTMYSEVLQDSTFDLIDAGKLRFASGSSITLSPRATPTCSVTWSATRTSWCCARRNLQPPRGGPSPGHHRHQYGAGVRHLRQRQLDPSAAPR